MNSKSTGGISIGTSSILVIFILLCLVTFAALSFITARADFSFTRRNADAALQYYSADSEASAKLAGIDAVLQQSASLAENKTDYYNRLSSVYENDDSVLLSLQGDKLFISFSVPVSEKLVLACTIRAEYPVNNGDGYYTVTAWQTRDSSLWQPDEHLPVYQSGAEEENSGEDSLSTGALPIV